MRVEVLWVDAGREPSEPPNPNYPLGIDVDLTGGDRPACRVNLPCPAPRIGHYRITCHDCGLVVGVSTAGRVDDPRSVKLRCKGPKAHE